MAYSAHDCNAWGCWGKLAEAHARAREVHQQRVRAKFKGRRPRVRWTANQENGRES